MDFALEKLDTKPLAETGVNMPLKQLDGSPYLNAEGKPITFRLRGRDSLAHQNTVRAINRRMAEINDTPTAEDVENNAVDLLMSLVLGWDGVLDTKGKPIPFNDENCRKLLKNYPAIRDQIDIYAADRKNFIKAP